MIKSATKVKAGDRVFRIKSDGKIRYGTVASMSECIAHWGSYRTIGDDNYLYAFWSDTVDQLKDSFNPPTFVDLNFEKVYLYTPASIILFTKGIL